MTHDIDIACTLGPLRLRAERADDHDFRFQLFCDSRLPEWYVVQLDPAVRAQIMRQQYDAQTRSYLMSFPRARFDIVELGGEPIGRIVVDRPGNVIHIVDQAIVPRWRNQGIGSTIMRMLMDEASAADLPVRLKVASSNDPSMRLYLKLGFRTIAEVPAYLEMEWPPAA